MSDKSETIDPKTFSVGDKVWIEGIIDEDGVVSLGGRWECVSDLTIVKHFPQPRPIAVGDRVKWRQHYTGRALGIHGDWVWFSQDPDRKPCSVALSDLERVEP